MLVVDVVIILDCKYFYRAKIATLEKSIIELENEREIICRMVRLRFSSSFKDVIMFPDSSFKTSSLRSR